MRSHLDRFCEFFCCSSTYDINVLWQKCGCALYDNILSKYTILPVLWEKILLPNHFLRVIRREVFLFPKSTWKSSQKIQNFVINFVTNSWCHCFFVFLPPPLQKRYEGFVLFELKLLCCSRIWNWHFVS